MPSRSTIRHRSIPAKEKSDAAEAVIDAQIDAQIEGQIEQIDALFAFAGLVRNRREKAAGVRRRARFQDKTPEELRPEPARPVRAANGVEWVAVPGWERIPWLWHGFSTRRGGVSTTYVGAGAEGELNLGFTADDKRENVLKNRELLAKAITGSARTPIVTLRQIHSGAVRMTDGAGFRPTVQS